jgi:hypothetical protein
VLSLRQMPAHLIVAAYSIALLYRSGGHASLVVSLTDIAAICVLFAWLRRAGRKPSR